nr:M24 family metallopeptidase [Entomospira culicis]
MRQRVVGISQSAQLLMQLFDYLEPLIVVGMTPSYFKAQAQAYALQLGVTLAPSQISFCRFGQVHPDHRIFQEEPLQAGEAFTLDIWILYQGYHADLARIYHLPPYRREILLLKKGALAVQEAAAKAAKAGERLLNIVQAAQLAAMQAGVSIVEGACGHGVGYALHEEPTIAFCYNAGSPFSRLKAGSIITIEPLIALKPTTLTIHNDGVVTLPAEIPFFYAEAMVYVGEHQSVVIGQ